MEKTLLVQSNLSRKFSIGLMLDKSTSILLDAIHKFVSDNNAKIDDMGNITIHARRKYLYVPHVLHKIGVYFVFKGLTIPHEEFKGKLIVR
jgi:hypothetical protein